MKAKTDLALALGIPTEPVLLEENNVPVLVPEPTATAAPLSDDDFHLARSNILKAIAKGGQLLDAMSDVAVQSDSARVFEVATDLMRGFVEVNEKLVDLHNRRMTSEPIGSTGPTTVNNLTIVGTTDEVLRKIIDARKNNTLIEHQEADAAD
jgi:hypothetical protein